MVELKMLFSGRAWGLIASVFFLIFLINYVSAEDVCGDGSCTGAETCSTCSQDCGQCAPICGNGQCESGETSLTCLTDCPAPACAQGYIPPAGCNCGGSIYSSGYCCNGIWQSNDCSQPCAEGGIPSSGCMCGGAMYYSGWCCSGVYKSTDCSQQTYCPYNSPITYSCTCGSGTYSSGYCCNGIWQSNDCTTQNYCPQGPIIYSCSCGGSTYSTGYCCNNVWQSTACTMQCSSNQLWNCYNQTDCKNAGGNWCNNYCQTSTCPTCSKEQPWNCYTQTECTNAGGYWCNTWCQSTTCPPSGYCGNGVCEGTETAQDCPNDCGQKQSCSALGGIICPENMTCPGTVLPAYDSSKCCNTQCATYQKACAYGSVPPEGCNCSGAMYYSGYCCNNIYQTTPCGEVSKCGNWTCESWYGETYQSCPSDCKPAACGDGRCDYMYGEYEVSCPQDCGSKCPNGICEGAETYITCHDDCKPPIQVKCGDGVCDYGMWENSTSCPQDCFSQTRCGNGICEYPETSTSCHDDCKPITYCGDARCDYGFGENEFNCEKDCPKNFISVCGNKMCEYGEDPTKCSVDCIQGKCGDNYCNFGEDPNTCASDCGAIIRLPVLPVCPPQEVINQVLEKCKLYGMQSYTRMTPDGCNIAECAPSSGPVPVTPAECKSYTDPVTGMERTECWAQTQCGPEPPEIKQHCIEQNGTPRLSRDSRGCEITICEYGAFGKETQPRLISEESCLAPMEIDKFARECRGKVLIEVAGNGCRYPRCEGERVGITETLCPAFNLDSIRKIEGDCAARGGRMYKMFDEKLCPTPKCVEPGQEETMCEDVPEEAHAKCSNDGGQLVVKKDEKNCVVFVDCVTQQKEKYEYDRIEELPETTELIAMAFNLEKLMVEFDKLQKKAEKIAEYYNSVGDSAAAEKFTKVASMFGSAKDRIEEIKDKMREIAGKEEEPTKKDIIELKLDIKEIKKILKNVLFVMLGVSKKEKTEEGKLAKGEDCGGDSACFMKNFKVCNKAQIVSSEGGGNKIIGEIKGLDNEACSYQIRLELEDKKYVMNCKEKDYAFAEFTPQRFRDTCTGDVEEFLGVMETKETKPQAQIGPTEEPIEKVEPIEPEVASTMGCRSTTMDGQPVYTCPQNNIIKVEVKKKNPWVGMIVGVRQWRK
ncbi:MAG: hypothetical protein AB1467_05050 [Candidatus Diapherotrites archaeon]